jgi:hypothetical protein
MTGLLLAALERLPARARRVVVAVGALLMLGAAIAALILTAPREGDGHPRRSASPPRPAAGVPQTSPQRLPPPVVATNLFRARLVAKRFLSGYLPFAYGRASAASVVGVTLALRRQLLRERVQVPPAERRRRPRVVSLQLVGTTPPFVVATAIIDDGGLTTYRLRFTLQRRSGGWAVTAVAG